MSIFDTQKIEKIYQITLIFNKIAMDFDKNLLFIKFFQ